MAHQDIRRLQGPPLALALALATSAAGELPAQGDYPFKKLSPATFGQNLRLSLSGMPQSRPMLFMVSLNGGPTPLASLIGQDPRSLEVGTDLQALWLLMSSGNGSLTLGFATPNDPSLQGTLIHLQTMVAGTGSRIVDKISNKIVIMPGASGTSALLGAKLAVARAGANTFALGAASTSASGSDVVLAGGGQGSLFSSSASGLASSEVYDLDRMSIRAGPKLTAPRVLCSATVLADGRVLLAGGVDNKGAPIATAEIHDPKQNKFLAVASMSTTRVGHGATLLPDGRVMVAGGAAFLPNAQLSNLLAFARTGVLNSCEIYDPANNKWSAAASIRERLLAPALTALPTGKVLLSGGIGVDTFLGIPIGMSSRANCNLYDPKNNRWAGAASMNRSRSAHDINVVVLKNGKALVTGGAGGSVTITNPSLANLVSLASAELYDPARNSWTAVANMAAARAGHTATLMPDGNVIVAGGASGPVQTARPVRSVQEFNAATNRWRNLQNLQVARAGHGAAVTADGLLVVFAGAGGTSNTTIGSIEGIHQ